MASVSPSCQVSPPGLFDGYVRITFDALSELAFVRKHAWEDEDLRTDFVRDDIPACKAGYCEWIADHIAQQISIGWAWFGLKDGRIFLAPGGLSSNVMLVSPEHYDLGMHRTHELLQCWISDEAWQYSLDCWDL